MDGTERRWSGRGEAARRRLLEAAGQVLAETGDVEVAAVARRAGVSVGLPYRYFGTRSGLLGAVVADFHDRLEQAVGLTEYPGTTWQERERARLTDWVRHLYDDPLSAVILGRQAGDADTAGVERQLLQQAIELGVRNMARGQADGDLPASLDPELLVAAILGGIHLAVTLALTRTPRPDREVVTDQLWAFVAASAQAGSGGSTP